MFYLRIINATSSRSILLNPLGKARKSTNILINGSRFQKMLLWKFHNRNIRHFKNYYFFIVEYYIAGPEITYNIDQILAYFGENKISRNLRNDSFKLKQSK